MKKILTLLLAAMLLVTPFCAVAEDVGEVTVEAAGLTVYLTPPLETILIGRDSSASVFNRAGLFQPQTIAYMKEWDIYALILSETDDSWEITLSVGESEEADMDAVAEFSTAMMCAWMEKDYEEAGYTDVKAEFFPSIGYPYIRVEAAYTLEDGYQGSIVTYYTTQSGHWLDVTLQCEGVPSEEALTAVEEIVHFIWCIPSA
ncbi:MAG: hypothetical protein E7327_09615 [Clostridiales bacterium]|nr:hypothetical protein [Clostridiales bacterium]